MRESISRWTRRTVVAGSAFGLAACAAFARGHAVRTYPLVVNNHTDFEVVVSSMPSLTGIGIRIGNARAFSTTTMAIPRNTLQSADRLVLRLHSIGSNVTPWVSPSTQLDSGSVVYLDLRADPNGGLSRSSLYTDVAGGHHP